MTSVGLSLFNYQDDARSNKHKISIKVACVLQLLISIGVDGEWRYVQGGRLKKFDDPCFKRLTINRAAGDISCLMHLRNSQARD